ncbi:MAG TPA: MBL fold metallo-hydrolase [Bacteroidales bacterium]|nr:MBL fold metallo-hydrolase [Bacteroidales bacterium]HPS17658.1 MBL fold metallo-hydrolase [Bacteroidales bacterium]
MIEVLTFFSPEYNSNTYILVKKDSGRAVIIDPTLSSITNILAYLKKKLLQVDYIIPTHGHFDHIEGVDELRRHYKTDVIANKECALSFQNPKKNYSTYFENKNIVISPPSVIIDNDEHQLNWKGDILHIIRTPGHSPCSICIYTEYFLFSGDTILIEYSPFNKFPDSNAVLLKESIKKIFTMFSGDLLVYPGHGLPFKLGTISSKFEFLIS